MTERVRDIAHVGAIELYSPVPEQSVDFFVRLMGMSEVGTDGDTTFVHSWDDYEQFTVAVTASDRAGCGRTWLRAASPEALTRRVAAMRRPGSASAGPTA